MRLIQGLFATRRNEKPCPKLGKLQSKPQGACDGVSANKSGLHVMLQLRLPRIL